jgi:hypothetical protein
VTDDEDPNMRAWKESNLEAAGMRRSAERWDIFRALTDCIVANFDDADWRRLADDIGERDGSVIVDHPRLLRSLAWSDPDYERNVRGVVEQILGRGLEHLDLFVSHTGLQRWTATNDARRHELLFPTDGVGLTPVVADDRLTTSGVRSQATELQGISLDRPDQVIGRAKNLVESTAKCVLHRLSPSTEAPSNFGALVSEAMATLGLQPRHPPGPDLSASAIRQLLGGLQNLATPLGELRNAVGDGHGVLEQTPPGDLREVAALARDAAVTACNFMLHALERRMV